jgi:hypothetical protein
MSGQDLSRLIADQRRLLMEKKVISEMLQQVRNEMQKLQVNEKRNTGLEGQSF